MKDEKSTEQPSKWSKFHKEIDRIKADTEYAHDLAMRRHYRQVSLQRLENTNFNIPYYEPFDHPTASDK